ncbi:MAG: hypothetical protein GY711_20150 [bacterium]|nr:hypothetical protein [bacterium]
MPDPTLAQHLAVLVEDRASSADALVREASEVLIGWFQALPEGWSWRDARRVLDVDLAAFREAHAWRGTVAGWLHTLDVAVSSALDRDVRVPARELLAEELGLWLGGDSGDDRGELPWNGEPLVSGRRIPARESCAQPFLADLERGEVILVHGFSDTVARAIEQVAARGLAPEVVLTEGGPDLGGRRMARRLGPCGAKLRLIYDAALANAVTRSDRIWLGTEAIGAQALVLRVGSRTLLEEARRLEVPSVVFATSDKLVPGGQLELPAWSERDQWLLWESAPEGVRVDSQAFEFVPLDLCDVFATEHGAQNAAELSLRALRTH